MSQPNQNQSSGAIEVRKNRPTHVSGETTLMDVLNFIERSNNPRHVRIINAVLFGKALGASPIPKDIAQSNVERFVLSSNKRELKQLEAALIERKEELYGTAISPF